jgi:hypothetical protein
MPFRPKKCIGKNVKFTPMKNNLNAPSFDVAGNLHPSKIGAQRVTPQRIPNTAPNDKT